ncbi:MAG: aminotransferase class I/II-fold pyridoxal phosphate-dependent enzyme, partial [bacterium]
MNIIKQRIKTDLRLEEVDLAKQIGRYAYFKTMSSSSQPITRIEGKDYFNFGSNNYLGLTNHQEVIEASKEAISKWGTGCTGSRLLNGTIELHLELEEELAAFYGKESALVFPTGYTANLGVLSSLLTRHDTVVVDERIHASLWDGIMLSKARSKKFDHNDPSALESLLSKMASPPNLCITEGVFSMEGDMPLLRELMEICKKNDIFLLVDEAHALGVVGSTGKGASEYYKVIKEVDAITITFSKSLAGCGGAVIGDKRVIDYIKMNSRPFLFTASNTPSSLASVLTSLKILQRQPQMIKELENKKIFFYDELKKNGIPVSKNESAILTIPIGD